MLLAFHKPYGVLSQFTSDGSKNTALAEFGFPPRVYALGRLDADSEGLLLLSNEPGLNTELLTPTREHPREYWAQVERVPGPEALCRLQAGITIGQWKCKRCNVRILQPQPELPERTPPIRFRKTVPTCWISLELVEGKNRQVRRMTATVGHPTLRLIRMKIGQFGLGNLAPGMWRELSNAERGLVFGERQGIPRARSPVAFKSG